MGEEPSKKKTRSFTSRLALALRPNPSRKRLVKQPSIISGSHTPMKGSASSTGNGFQTRIQRSPQSSLDIDIQTGERRDDTALLHGLAHQDSFDTLESLSGSPKLFGTEPNSGAQRITSLPHVIWDVIASYLSPTDAASLAHSSKILHNRLGNNPWIAIDQPENWGHRIQFLTFMDSQLPDYLFCYSCAKYHLRTQKGHEQLKPTQTLNPLFKCPLAAVPTTIPLRMRLATGHTLPFSFVQLVMRGRRYSPDHGIPLQQLSRRWKDRDSEWSHQTSYFIHKGHLLLRIISMSYASPELPPSGQRHLLYSPRDDFAPRFSACAHWRDGELMNLCKCALGHIPKPKSTVGQQFRKGPQIQLGLRNTSAIVTLCRECRPIRRCPECPTEYLIEIKIAEDKNDSLNRFKQAIVVTRWSNLGNGTTPISLEWAACNGEAEYNSFANIGKRGISGTFESQSGVAIPGQRMLSLNPKNEKHGEEGNNWY